MTFDDPNPLEELEELAGILPTLACTETTAGVFVTAILYN
jgi:hypothetical protein